MHIHILGICGTFMGGVAVLAKELGYKVTGSDQHVYPPMSTQLAEQGIELTQGFDPKQLDPAPDLVVIGNAMSRGNPCVEYVLDRNLPYVSGPQWLLEHVLKDRWVLAVAGTHGKTSTASMLAYLLDDAGLEPGFLIGGVPGNFPVSARLGETPFFVIEADEYDCAFFDKRSKFVHYHPRTLILNNLEFDHADIFPDLAAIQRQFHHLMRTVPSSGRVLYPHTDAALNEVLAQGCWSECEAIGNRIGWHAVKLRDDASQFEVWHEDVLQGVVEWNCIGDHNMNNALMALAAARHVGVRVAHAIESLKEFRLPKRRMELRGEVNGIALYDDFAHHPTAITTTLNGLRQRVGKARIVAVLEPRSNTMKLGVHKHELAHAFGAADQVFFYQPDGLGWSMDEVISEMPTPAKSFNDLEALIAALVAESQSGDQLVIMSNGGFGGIHDKLLKALAAKVE